jgi:hypothetical protein
MIKFFRKLRFSSLSRKRFPKYLLYATGEIVLVVIGILIALQINRWNEGEKNNDLEEQYRNRLLEDLKEEKAIMQATINYSEEVHRHALKAIVKIENPTLLDENPAETLIDFYQASQIQDPASAKSTYQELIASGQINLLDDIDLKTSLIRYYEYDWTEATSVKLNNPFRTNLRSKMDNSIQEEIRNNCNDIYVKIRKTYEVTLPKDCTVNIPKHIAEPALAALRADETLKRDLRVLIGNIEAKTQFITSLQKQLDDLINQFEITEQ